MKRYLTMLFALAAVFTLVSCASLPSKNISYFPEIEIGSLPEGKYTILGEISGVSKITVKQSDIEKERKALYSVDVPFTEIEAVGDTGNYGFINKDSEKYLTVYERAIALAEYDLIETAEYNKANAVICVRRNVKSHENGNKTVIVATVTAIAVRVDYDKSFKFSRPTPPVVVEEPKEEKAPVTPTVEVTAEDSTAGSEDAASETSDAPAAEASEDDVTDVE